MSLTIDLGGQDWEFGFVERSFRDDDYDRVSEWLPATVPGGVHADLAALGQIPDPYVADNLEASRWVEDYDWWYRRRFARPVAGSRFFLACHGIDYHATIFLNGHRLGTRDGMFALRAYELTDLLEDENLLAVRISGAWRLPQLERSAVQDVERWLARRLLGAELYPDRFATLKCQMSYGWDFAPRLPNIGVWDRVLLRQSDDVYIHRMRIDAIPADMHAQIEVALDVDVSTAGRAQALLKIVGPAGEEVAGQSYPLLLPTGPSVQRLSLHLDHPTLWQPWDRGAPHLYRAHLTILRDGEQGEECTEEFGVRSVRLARGGGTWSLQVNEEKEYLRGVNWVPADAIYGRVRPEDYARLIAQARAAHVNMLRVWGGGLREKKEFYALCDREGLLVWQEFPFACAFFDRFPSDAAYLRLVEQEARGIVDTLYNHPSVVLWCGGNELNPRRNRHVVGVLSSALRHYGDRRPFVPASPGGGDAHNWRVWGSRANLRDYRKEQAPMLSEFGLQALPGAETLERILTEGQGPGATGQETGDEAGGKGQEGKRGKGLFALWPFRLFPFSPPSPPALPERTLLARCGVDGELERVLAYHSAQLDKLARYAEAYHPASFAELIEATQRAQAQGLQVAIEHYRRRRDRTGGTLVWQLNEPWPAVSWSLIDYYGAPKQAYWRLRELYNPLLVSLDYPLRRYEPGDVFAADVWVINDWSRGFSACELTCGQGGEEVWRRRLEVPASGLLLAGRLELTVAAAGDLEVQLSSEGAPLSHNSYDLTYGDDREISLQDAVRNWIAWHALEV